MNHRNPLRSPALLMALAGSAIPVAAGPFPATIELSSLDGMNGFVINGDRAGDSSGNAVSCAGDVNGDGVVDLVIGAMNADPLGRVRSGRTYLVFGGADVGSSGALDLSMLSATSGVFCYGIDQNDFSGWSVSSVGDLNGDGFADVIIGAPGADPTGMNSAGESYVVFGGAGITSLSLASIDGTNGFVCSGIDASDSSGWSVSCAGDVNGDGLDDAIIGAINGSPNGRPSAGEAYIIFGSVLVGSGGTLNLSALDGTNGFICYGVNIDDWVGYSVSAAGDVNGDGLDDFVLGAPSLDANGMFNAGGAYVVFGAASIGSGGTLELSSLNGANGFVCNGVTLGDKAGYAVSGAGDFNGDGYGDLAISVYLHASPKSDIAPECYIVYGGTDIGAGGSIDLSDLDGSNGVACRGIPARDRRRTDIAAAGDVNGDGFNDIIIGDNYVDPNGIDRAGVSYVVFGGSAVGSGGLFDLATLDGANGFRCNGINTSDLSGRSVSGAGDFNDDGIDDIIIAAQQADPNGQSGAGETYIIFGRAACPPDINGDGTVDTADLGALIGQFGTAGPEADLNGDNTVDTADLGILIAAFGSACP